MTNTTSEQFNWNHYPHFRRVALRADPESKALFEIQACIRRLGLQSYKNRATSWLVEDRTFIIVANRRAVCWTLMEYFPDFVRIRTDIEPFNEIDHQRIKHLGAKLVRREDGGELTMLPSELPKFDSFFRNYTINPDTKVPIVLESKTEKFERYEWSAVAHPLYNSVQQAVCPRGAVTWNRVEALRISAEIEQLS